MGRTDKALDPPRPFDSNLGNIFKVNTEKKTSFETQLLFSPPTCLSRITGSKSRCSKFQYWPPSKSLIPHCLLFLGDYKLKSFPF